MGNAIHPTAVIGPEVDLGSGNTIGPGVVLFGPLQIGDDNWFGAHTVVGAPAEIRGTDHGAAWDGRVVGAGVTIGSGTVVREMVTDLISHGVGATVPTTVRETVGAVGKLAEAGCDGVSLTRVAQKLGLDKSTASRRATDAITRGHLKNLEEKKGPPRAVRHRRSAAR